MSETYFLWKFAHIVSAAILFGTGLGTAFFCWFGYRNAIRESDLGTLRTVLRLTVIADYCFTAPAVVFQAFSGLVLMHLLGWPWLSRWSVVVFGLFVFIGACWLPVVALQVRLSREAVHATTMEQLPAHFHRRFRWWFALGLPAFIAVVLTIYLMVAKFFSVSTL